MKFKTTRKAIVAGSNPLKLLAIGYCGAQYILTGLAPVAYTAGVYGWNYDVYEVGGFTICTGYRNMPGRAPRNLATYEYIARQVWEDREASYEEKLARISEIRRDFLGQC
jgi:hypothetical protein